MVKLNLTGTITDIFREEQVSDKLTKRTFWLIEPDRERYPQHWEIELHNDDCKRLKDFRIGQVVECEVELRGRLYERGIKKFIYNSLKCIGLKAVPQA